VEIEIDAAKGGKGLLPHGNRTIHDVQLRIHYRLSAQGGPGASSFAVPGMAQRLKQAGYGVQPVIRKDSRFGLALSLPEAVFP